MIYEDINVICSDKSYVKNFISTQMHVKGIFTYYAKNMALCKNLYLSIHFLQIATLKLM